MRHVLEGGLVGASNPAAGSAVISSSSSRGSAVISSSSSRPPALELLERLKAETDVAHKQLATLHSRLNSVLAPAETSEPKPSNVVAGGPRSSFSAALAEQLDAVRHLTVHIQFLLDHLEV